MSSVGALEDCHGLEKTAFEMLQQAHPVKRGTALEASFWQNLLAHRAVRDGAVHFAQLEKTQTQRHACSSYNIQVFSLKADYDTATVAKAEHDWNQNPQIHRQKICSEVTHKHFSGAME